VRSLTQRAMSAWPDLSALGAEVVMQRVAEGEGEAQFSQGCRLMRAAGGNADVGWHFAPHSVWSLTRLGRVHAVTWLASDSFWMPTLGGGGRGAVGEGGSARARVCYE
jgi:hypothetical protein